MPHWFTKGGSYQTNLTFKNKITEFIDKGRVANLNYLK